MSEVQSLYGGAVNRRVRTRDLIAAKERGERWPMLTSYDQYTAGIFDEAGIPVLLVGDSAANNVFGYETTVPVTVDELLPLVRAVVRATKRTLVVGDLPFGSYEEGPTQALRTAVRFMKEGGCHAVKLEGGRRVAPQIAALTGAGIPVMAHIGFTPQSEHAFGGYRVQGRGDAGDDVVADAHAVAEAARSRWCWRWCRARSPSGSRTSWRSRRSASAPAPTPTRRCSSGRTWPACALAARHPGSSSATPTWPAP